jgi:nitrate reductase assembly molybdenum cofactor insertion protein NarJ
MTEQETHQHITRQLSEIEEGFKEVKTILRKREHQWKRVRQLLKGLALPEEEVNRRIHNLRSQVLAKLIKEGR